MKKDHRVFLVFLLNGFFYTLTVELNQMLASFSLQLSLESLLLLFPALFLRLLPGLCLVSITALLIDAALPLPFGTRLGIYCLIYILLVYWRPRIRRENLLHLTGLSLLANLVFMITLSVCMAGELWLSSFYWSRVLTDLLISQIALVFITAWFIQFILSILLLFGINIEAELQTL